MASINAKSTKQEVFDAYQALLQENQELTKRVETLQKEKSNLEAKIGKASSSPATFETSSIPKDKSLTVVSYKIGDVIDAFKNIRSGFGNAVSELSTKLTQKSSELSALQNEISEIEAYINELHEIGEIKEDTLATILEEYLEKSELFSKEYSQKEEALNTQLSEIESAWEKEQAAYQSQLNERNEELSKARKREKEEYHYTLSQTRAQLKDAYEQEKKQLQEALTLLKEQKEKEWAAKEKEITDKELDYADTKAKAAELEEKKGKEIQKSVESVKGAIRRDAAIRENILAKEVEGKKRLNEVKIQALQRNIEQQEQKITSLNKQLSEVLREAKELAVKAIDGASSAKSFEALREITSEQGKNSLKK
ncbi:MAG: hypothetical protein SFU27_07445 [Thermonemataceae bacterium]|nr:hypothetical protein [Thermonemataceae bacterium]